MGMDTVLSIIFINSGIKSKLGWIFFKELRKSVEPIYKEIIEHLFDIKLAEGNLSKDKFRLYIHQDVFNVGEF